MRLRKCDENPEKSFNNSSCSISLDMSTEKIIRGTEIIDINDAKETSSELHIPHEREIVDAIISIWKSDPSTETLGFGKLHALVKKSHPFWTLSEKRVKLTLKKFGLASNQDQFTYSNDITSYETPDIDLPENVKIVMTSKRGKGLYSNASIEKGEVIWDETQLFFVPPLANAELIKIGKACCFCGKLLNQSGRGGGTSVLRGLDCNVCPEIWCSSVCKKRDQIHAPLKHNVYTPGKKSKENKSINSHAFFDLQKYCIKEQWNALYAITLIQANIVTDKLESRGRQFKAMARVSQSIRYKALNSSAGMFDNVQGGALFVQEQQESLWKEGYEKFSEVFPQSNISYDEFLEMMGTYNINNLDSCIYLVQSHLNHNCNPNTSVETSTTSRTEGLKVFAARDIRAGEELTTSYVNPSHSVQQRQRELRVNWGFICKCQKCKDDLNSQQRRKSSADLGKDKTEIRNMLKETQKLLSGGEIELTSNENSGGERRKSVRFDEKVQVNS